MVPGYLVPSLVVIGASSSTFFPEEQRQSDKPKMLYWLDNASSYSCNCYRCAMACLASILRKCLQRVSDTLCYVSMHHLKLVCGHGHGIALPAYKGSFVLASFQSEKPLHQREKKNTNRISCINQDHSQKSTQGICVLTSVDENRN